MPQNSRTGKTIRQLLTAKYVFEYRLEQHNDKMKSNLSSQLVGQRGKKVVRTQQEDLQPEAQWEVGWFRGNVIEFNRL